MHLFIGVLEVQENESLKW